MTKYRYMLQKLLEAEAALHAVQGHAEPKIEHQAEFGLVVRNTLNDVAYLVKQLAQAE